MSASSKQSEELNPWDELSRIAEQRVNDLYLAGLIIPISKRGLAKWRIFVPEYTVTDWANLAVSRPDVWQLGPCRLKFNRVGRGSIMSQGGMVQGYYVDMVFLLEGDKTNENEKGTEEESGVSGY